MVVHGVGSILRNHAVLPDHLLLDIGVDPRDVPFNVAGEIARPDLAHSGPATATFRTIAKS